MDGANLEPDDRLHQDFARLQALLRRGDGVPSPGYERIGVRKRVRVNAASIATRTTAATEKTNRLLRELNE